MRGCLAVLALALCLDGLAIDRSQQLEHNRQQLEHSTALQLTQSMEELTASARSMRSQLVHDLIKLHTPLSEQQQQQQQQQQPHPKQVFFLAGTETHPKHKHKQHPKKASTGQQQHPKKHHSKTISEVPRLRQRLRAQALPGDAPHMTVIHGCAGYQCSQGDDETQNLILALQQLKNDITDRTNLLMDDKRWVDQVKLVLGEYEMKMRRVVDHMIMLRGQAQGLYKKKRQVENVLLQKKLSEKLQDASGDLTNVHAAMRAAEYKQNAFMQSRQAVVGSIAHIQQQLALLRTSPSPQPPPPPPPSTTATAA